MSVPIGISPTDIVKGVAAVHKAATALKSNDHGAQHQYQQVKKALAHRIRALEDLSASTAEALPQAGVQSAPLLDVDRAFQYGLGSYEQSLGRGAPSSARQGITRKLKFAFGGQKDVQAHLDSSRPAVDAAVFRTMQAQIEIVKGYHQQSSDKLDDFMLTLNERLDSINNAYTSNDQLRTVELMNESSTSLEAVSVDLQSSMSLPIDSSASFKNQSPGKYRPCNFKVPLIESNRKAKSKPRARRLVRAEKMQEMPRPGKSLAQSCDGNDPTLPGAFVREDIHSQPDLEVSLPQSRVSESPSSLLHTDAEADDAARFVSNILCAVFAVSLTASYQNPNVQKILTLMIHTSRKDPLFAALFACMIAALARCLIQVPRQILLLADDSIRLETALGDALKVPSCYWKAHATFHGFLETHFDDRPGRNLVACKSYRILIGGIEGQVIDVASWSKVIDRRMRLTMAMVLDNYDGSCPKCKGALVEDLVGKRQCVLCGKSYDSINKDKIIAIKFVVAPESTISKPETGVDASALFVNVMLRILTITAAVPSFNVLTKDNVPLEIKDLFHASELSSRPNRINEPWLENISEDIPKDWFISYEEAHQLPSSDWPAIPNRPNSAMATHNEAHSDKPVLQGRQMQLMLLEQQNTKRVMMARQAQEQENAANRAGSPMMPGTAMEMYNQARMGAQPMQDGPGAANKVAHGNMFANFSGRHERRGYHRVRPNEILMD